MKMSVTSFSPLLVAIVLVSNLAAPAFAQNVTVTMNTIPSGGWCNFYSPPGNYVASTPPTTFPSSGVVGGSIETACFSSGGTRQSDDVISFNQSAATINVSTLPPPSGGWANFYQNGVYQASTPPTTVSGYQPVEVQYKNSGGTMVVDETYTWDSTVIMSSPVKGSTGSGPINVVTLPASNVSWENIYVDGSYLTSSPPRLFSWDSILVSNGSHTISSNAYNSGGTQIGTTNASITVSNGTPNAVYVSSSSGNDNNSGTQSAPWRTMAKVISQESSFSAGEHILFKGGDTWNEVLTLNNVHGTSINPIVFGSYGSGRPIIDGQNTLNSCVSAVQTDSSHGLVSDLTVTGFECLNTTQYGINFDVNFTSMPGIVIANNYVHDTGPGSDSGYYNSINAEDDTAGRSGGDGFQIINNVVKNCNGHNCIQVHYDVGGPVVKGNVVGPGCKFHNCIDVKGVVNGQVTGNTATCPNCTLNNAGFYIIENTLVSNADVTWQDNLAYSIPVGFQIETGGSCSGSRCATSAKLYNNTVYGATVYDVIDSSCDSSSSSPISQDVQKNIFSGGTVNIHTGSGCSTIWNYNDDFGTSGAPSGSNNINTDPQFLNASAGYFTSKNWTVLNAGQPDTVTSFTFLGGLP